MQPVIFVIGKPQHGKSTVRTFLSERLKLRGASCSDTILAVIENDLGKEKFAEWMKLPKEQRRSTLIKVGDALCGLGQLKEAVAEDPGYYVGPSALIRALFHSGVRIIDGVRRRIELADAIKHLEWCGVPYRVIRVTRPGGPEIADNTEDLSAYVDTEIVNDGTIVDLCQKLDKLFPMQNAA